MTTNVVRCTSLISHVTLRQKGLAPDPFLCHYKRVEERGTTPDLHHHSLLSSQMKILPLLTLTLTTTASVVALQDQAQAADMTRQSQQAITQIYNHYKIDEAHWDLLVAVAKKGTVVKFGGSSCKDWTDKTGATWTTQGYYGWDNGKTEMVFCPAIQGKANLQSTIRHEVGHKIQDLKDGVRGDGRLAPFYNTQDPEFWGFYSKSNKIDHEYVESYKKAGDMKTYRLEADAEVQQTESAGTLIDRLFRF